MKRRKFLKCMGAGAAVAVAAPVISRATEPPVLRAPSMHSIADLSNTAVSRLPGGCAGQIIMVINNGISAIRVESYEIQTGLCATFIHDGKMWRLVP